MAENFARDELAVERTHLANERTLLAYIRTALASAGAGVLLLQFYPKQFAFNALVWILIIAGAGMLIFGFFRFISVRTNIDKK